ncbi:MAG: hypothetical protein AAGL24_10185 [Pseudomonadota bacterium]
MLIIKDAGRGETPVPADAVLQPGDEVGINNPDTGDQESWFCQAVVPAGGNVDYAIADQNGEPRPLATRSATHDEIAYVFRRDDAEIIVLQSSLLRGKAAADAAGLNPES